jgi:hypothetical protein
MLAEAQLQVVTSPEHLTLHTRTNCWSALGLCFSEAITIQDINRPPLVYLKQDVSKTGLCLRLQLVYTQLGPIDAARPYLRTVSGPEAKISYVDWNHLNRFHLKTETESSLRNAVF